MTNKKSIARISLLMVANIKSELSSRARPEKAAILSRFFKTGKGQYGEGDVFLGITVPEQRKIAKTYAALPRREIQTLLSSSIHEYRLTALLILITQFEKVDEESKKKIVDFYLHNLKYINNWDLVDLSAVKLLGAYLIDKDTSLLYGLAESESLWERRISIMATFHFIRQYKFKDTLKIAEYLLHDREALVHKAVGWMLRETGKRDLAAEEGFLNKYYKTMPRTMLRYAIEKFDKEKREFYLKK